jgi:hypothetical protein
MLVCSKVWRSGLWLLGDDEKPVKTLAELYNVPPYGHFNFGLQ